MEICIVKWLHLGPETNMMPDIQVSVLRMEINQATDINQYDITMATHYDITMGNDVARDAHFELT